MRLKLKVDPDLKTRKNYYIGDTYKDSAMMKIHDVIDSIIMDFEAGNVRDGFVKITLVDQDEIDHYADIGDVIRIDEHDATKQGIEPGDYLVLSTHGQAGMGIHEEWSMKCKLLENGKYNPHAPMVEIYQIGPNGLGIGRLEVVGKMHQTWV